MDDNLGPLEPFEKILREATRPKVYKEKFVPIEKAVAEFKRVPTGYKSNKCYKFDFVCSNRCMFWDYCTRKTFKGGNIG